MMHEPEKSDRRVVPRKSSNNAARTAAEGMEGRRLVKGRPVGNARSGRRTGPACHLRRRGPVAQLHGSPKPERRNGITQDRSPVRESRTYGSGAARLAAIPAGASPANTRSPVHVVVIPSGREGDQTAESLEVKALWGRGDLVRSVKGGRATWQAVA